MQPVKPFLLATGLFFLTHPFVAAQCPTSGNTVTVTNTSSNILTANSFAWAINCINTTPPLNTVVFNIPGAGANTINLTIALPNITKPNAVIDGTAIESVVLDGTNIVPGGPPANGLVLADVGITVRGIEIRNFTNTSATGGHAIRIQGAQNYTIANNRLHGNRIGIGAISTVTVSNIDITGNTIGLNGSGAASSNTSAGIVFPSPVINVDIAGNVVAHNGSGITVPNGSVVTVRMSENSIYCNNGAGIVRSEGPNPPTITSATVAAISGTAGAGQLIEVFESDLTGCPSAAQCQGRRFLGAVTANASGAWTLTLTAANPVTAGNSAIATATLGGNNTSRFSNCLQIQGCNLSVSITTNAIDCNGDTNGSLTAVPSGGAGPFFYSWTGGGNTQTISGLGPGTYTVVVTQATTGCTATGSATLVNPPPMTLGFSTTNVLCFGQANGAATALPGGGVPPYGYQWSTNATTPTITGLAPGVYSVTVNDSNPCRIFGSVTITQPGALSLTVTAEDETAFNADDGQATATVTGGVMPYTYLWSNGGMTSTISNLSPGTYAVTVTDANGCMTTGSATVAAFICGPFSVTIAGTPPLCNGNSNGSAMANPVGGAGPYAYLWNTGAMTQTISGLAAGGYAVTVTDADNCPATQSVVLTAPPPVTLTVTATDQSLFNVSNGSATATAAGGTGILLYNWSNGGMSSTITGLAPGTYTVTVTDQNGCTRVGSATVDALVCPGFVVEIEVLDVSCNGNGDGALTAVPDGSTAPFTFLWSTGAMTPFINDLIPGIYSVTVSDALGCPETATGIVTQPDPFVVAITTTDQSAVGVNDGTAMASTSGGTGNNIQYAWSNDETGALIAGLPPGTYSVTATDENGCIATSSAVVASASCAGFSVSITNVVHVACNGATTGSATASVSGGGQPWTYAWSNNSTGPNLVNAGAGTYSVTVVNTANCTDIASVTINQPPALALACSQETAVSQPGGSDGQGRVQISGGTANYTISYSGPSSGQLANVTPGVNLLSGLPAGTYAITVTDGNGCAQTCGFTISAANCMLAIDSIAVTNIVSCFGGDNGALAVQVSNGSGNLIFTWNDPALNGQQNPTGLPAGTYSVTVSDGAGCIANGSATLDQPAELTVAVTATGETVAGANDGTATAVVSGGVQPYQYLWSNGFTLPAISNVGPGVYTVTVTSAFDVTGACRAVGSATVSAGGMGGGDCRALPAYALSIPDEVCQHDQFTLEAQDLYPSPDVRYVWLLPNGDSLLTVDSFVNVIALSTAFSGEYFVIRDSLGCRSVPLGGAPLTVLGLPEGAVSAGADTVVCGASSLTLTALPLAVGTGTWRSLGGAKITQPAQPVTAVSNLQAGANRFIWEVSIDGCPQAAADTVTVFVEQKPALGDDNYRLQFAQQVLVMEVLLNDHLAGLTDTTVQLLNQPEEGTLEYLEATHRFRYQVEEGFRGIVTFQYAICPPESDCDLPCDTATVRIEVLNLPSVPEGLVVNDPGLNGSLSITGIGGFTRVEIAILNRWGDLVYHSEDYAREATLWDGTMRSTGQALPQGAYYYQLRAYEGNTQIGDTQIGIIHLFEQKF